ncbi:MAG: dTDP-4-dehydrorhamnose reductase [Candidatus Yanofskybacteria bacterium RIFCSPLOWO2_01_FULL_49_25]|uniref:dTDP-4-dehydrorhamnose reductase n=1 Tax=Candidatus Yanofskybacteria bacterium RIFCSPLOWO2_01_FULL_49_25 TaxID=1802701 RepID=A0A1F8GX42_9BACT|nr:MAG: dTDP-4-dehydrorhamnose reductase [Candidatus Yanofskybacteria bacterium RIFCSPLOWO2_01_FULL_49_25]
MKPTVLIFGADGQLGADLARSFSGTHNVVLSTKDAVDITDAEQVRSCIEHAQPTLVVNSAAFTNVQDNENRAAESFNVNAIGAFHVAGACARMSIPVMYISTDYVFDGNKELYSESDIPHPVNIYGASKYAGELLSSVNPRTYIIRTSALFGAHASGKGYNFVGKMLELGRQKDEIKVVDELITSPTYTRDLAEKIHELIVRALPPGTYHITNQGSCSWFDFAVEIMRQSGLHPRIVPISAKEYAGSLVRPQKTVLENYELKKMGMSLLPTWNDGLKRYLQEIGKYHAD